MSIFQPIDKRKIMKNVMSAISKAKIEIFATMDLREELKNPLSQSYHALLEKKINEGIILKRLGFGNKDDYIILKKRYFMVNKKYTFRFYSNVLQYQRLILIDKNLLYLKIDNKFYVCREKEIIEGFEKYFFEYFKKGIT